MEGVGLGFGAVVVGAWVGDGTAEVVVLADGSGVADAGVWLSGGATASLVGT